MRNAVIARDPVAQAAGQSLVTEGATATDIVLAMTLAGAARASSSALLGAGGFLVAGTGVGAHFIDARARAPGLGEKRPRTPDPCPDAWTAAVPGLLEGVLAAHARFGALPLAEVVRAAVAAVRESEPDDATRARLKLLLQLHRTGIHALERLGVLQSVLQTVGPVAGGVFTRDDLVPRAAPVRALATCLDGPDELLLPPRRSGRYGATPPDPLPALRVDGALAMDRHGVVAAAAWVVPPAAVGLEGVEGFALPALVPRARKGVARWRPGEPLPVPLPLAVMLHEGRAWGAVALSGAGDLVAARDAVVTARLAQAGIALPVGEGDGEGGAFARDTVAMWALRDADGDGARATMTAVETA